MPNIRKLALQAAEAQTAFRNQSTRAARQFTEVALDGFVTAYKDLEGLLDPGVRLAEAVLRARPGRGDGPGQDDDDHDEPPMGDGDNTDSYEPGSSRFNPDRLLRDLHTVDRSDWERVQPIGGGAWCEYLPSSPPVTQAKLVVECGYATGFTGGGNKPTEDLLDNLTQQDLEFKPSPEYGRTLWGNRFYNVIDGVFRRIWGHDFGERSEHLYYVNPVGSVQFVDIVGERLGGQLIQLKNTEEGRVEAGGVHRPPENSPVRGGLVEIDRFAAIDCGLNEGRGSFPISLKNLGRPGRLFDVWIKNGLIRSAFRAERRSGIDVSATGGILVKGTGVDDWHNGNIRIENVTFDLTRTSHAMLQLNNARSIEIRNCRFLSTDGHYPDILIDRQDGAGYEGAKRTGRFLIHDCEGNVNVRVAGERIGSCTERREIVTDPSVARFASSIESR